MFLVPVNMEGWFDSSFWERMVPKKRYQLAKGANLGSCTQMYMCGYFWDPGHAHVLVEECAYISLHIFFQLLFRWYAASIKMSVDCQTPTSVWSSWEVLWSYLLNSWRKTKSTKTTWKRLAREFVIFSCGAWSHTWWCFFVVNQPLVKRQNTPPFGGIWDIALDKITPKYMLEWIQDFDQRGPWRRENFKFSPE